MFVSELIFRIHIKPWPRFGKVSLDLFERREFKNAFCRRLSNALGGVVAELVPGGVVEPIPGRPEKWRSVAQLPVEHVQH